MKNMAWKQHADLDKFRQLYHYIFNISSLLQKFNFLIEVVLSSLQTQKGLELVLRLHFLQNFFMNFFLL